MASNKPLRILVFIDWYLPGYRAGGPIRSVANLVKRLPHDFSIVTSDRDHMSTTPYEGISSDTWTTGPQGEQVLYLPPASQHRKRLKAIIRETDCDVIYINSLFSLRFALLPLWVAKRGRTSARIILAPRGMLKSGALTVKAGKKKWFLRGAKLIGLFKDIRWHATNHDERKEIQRTFGDVDIRVAPNLVVASDASGDRLDKARGTLRLVSVARVSQEKNVLKSLDYIAGMNGALGEVELTWYGTHQDQDYLQQCRARAADIPHAKIDFPGAIPPQQIPDVLRSAHFFFLPTLGENYGHAIVESFLNGLPVLISDRTPWTQLEEKKAGWELPLDRILFSEILNHLVVMEQEDYAVLTAGAAQLGQEIANSEKDFNRNQSLFNG